jgi:hypothetical protein
MLGDTRFEDFGAEIADSGQSSGLILTHEAAVANNICSQDGG